MHTSQTLVDFAILEDMIATEAFARTNRKNYRLVCHVTLTTGHVAAGSLPIAVASFGALPCDIETAPQRERCRSGSGSDDDDDGEGRLFGEGLRSGEIVGRFDGEARRADAAGMPEMTPVAALSERPAGSEPEVIDQVRVPYRGRERSNRTC